MPFAISSAPIQRHGFAQRSRRCRVKISGMRVLPVTAILAADGLSTQKSGAKWSAYFRFDRPRQYVRFGSFTSIRACDRHFCLGPAVGRIAASQRTGPKPHKQTHAPQRARHHCSTNSSARSPLQSLFGGSGTIIGTFLR
jgi:hypothetical protein